ncbi:MAG: inositol monophosphatase family protein, partial [Natronospirillum sp.]
MTLSQNRYLESSGEATVALNERLQLAKQVARAAGLRALAYFNHSHELTVKTKGKQDWVSEADTEVERYIREALNTSFPEDDVIGEEDGLEGKREDSLLWIIDPIDGTTCFLKGIPQWCIVIALADGPQTLLSVIYDPNADELFCAVLGQGAWCNDQPIQVASAEDITSGLISVGTSVKLGAAQSVQLIEWLVDNGGMYSRIGSCALALAYVAKGRLLGMYEPLIHPWDSWGGLLLVSEAGGRVSGPEQGAQMERAGPSLATAPA